MEHIDQFVFTGVIMKERQGYTALCLELDVASQGDTIQEAKEALLEAVTLYLETAFENNVPYLRPVPPDANPLLKKPRKPPVEVLRFKVDFAIHAHV